MCVLFKWCIRTQRRILGISLLDDPDVLSVLVCLASACIIIRILRRCFITGRMPRSGKLPVLFYSQAKNQVFRPVGATRCTDSGQTLKDRRHLGPLGSAKFHINRRRGVGMRPQKYQKFPLFGKESPRRGDSLDRFPKFLGAFIRLTILR